MTGPYLGQAAVVGPKVLQRSATLDEFVEGLAAGRRDGVVRDVEADDRLAGEDLGDDLKRRQHLLISLREDIIQHAFLVRPRIP